MGIEHVVLWHQMGIMEPDWYEARAGSLVLQIYSNWDEDLWILLNASGLPEDAEPSAMPELYRHADLAEVKLWGLSWIASGLHQERDAIQAEWAADLVRKGKETNELRRQLAALRIAKVSSYGGRPMSDVDTSAEAVEGLAKHHDLMHPKVETVTLFGDTSQKTADVLRALKAERDGLKASRDACARVVGSIVSAIPLGDIIKASGTLGDTIDYVKAAIAERDALRAQLAAARDSALEEAAAAMSNASANCRDKFTYPPKNTEERDYQTGAILHAQAAKFIRALKTQEPASKGQGISAKVSSVADAYKADAEVHGVFDVAAFDDLMRSIIAELEPGA